MSGARVCSPKSTMPRCLPPDSTFGQALKGKGSPVPRKRTEAKQAAPYRVPSEQTARAVWDLVSPYLRGARGKPVTLDDLMARKFLKSPSKRQAGELAAMQALAVAIDTILHLGRSVDRSREGTGQPKALRILRTFNTLAYHWSPTFRETPGTSLVHKKESTVKLARKEMLAAGVDHGLIWSVVNRGIEGLYSSNHLTRRGWKKKGKGGWGGRSIKPMSPEGSPAARQYQSIMDREYQLGVYRGPREHFRVLRADEPTPPLTIDQEIIGEVAYDVMDVGEPTRLALERLGETELFQNVPALQHVVDDLETRYDTHPWPEMLKAWRDERVDPFAEVHRRDFKAFCDEHQKSRNEYRSIGGRYRQHNAELHQVLKHRDHFEYEDGTTDLRIKTAHYVGRNRRMYPTRQWLLSSSSKENDSRPFAEINGATQYLKNTNRGLLYRTHASGLNIEHERPESSLDIDPGEDKRHLEGFDMRASMYHIRAIFCGDRVVEQFLVDHDFKSECVKELLELEVFHHLDKGNPGVQRQMRNSVGVIGNTTYGAMLHKILSRLKEDRSLTGDWWRNLTIQNMRELVAICAQTGKALPLLVQVNDEYMRVVHAVVREAASRGPYAGVWLTDTFDGQQYWLNRPEWEYKTLRHGLDPVSIRVPVGQPNEEGRYPVNYYKGEGCIDNFIVPGIIHSLDSSYARHVITGLWDLGVRDMAVVFDCFLVAADAIPELQQVLREAGRPWYEGFPLLYDALLEYLEGTPEGAIVHTWKDRWDKRMADIASGHDYWPVLNFKRETTVELTVELTENKTENKPENKPLESIHVG